MRAVHANLCPFSNIILSGYPETTRWQTKGRGVWGSRNSGALLRNANCQSGQSRSFDEMSGAVMKTLKQKDPARDGEVCRAAIDQAFTSSRSSSSPVRSSSQEQPSWQARSSWREPSSLEQLSSQPVSLSGRPFSLVSSLSPFVSSPWLVGVWRAHSSNAHAVIYHFKTVTATTK